MAQGDLVSSDGLVGTASDEVPEILATGRSGITTLFVSMSARHPDGEDVSYLRWHTLDHRPEQYRLASIKSSLRLVSTPACRAVRAVSGTALDATDHVMTYFFSDIAGLQEFVDLAEALGGAGRMPYLLPSVQHGVYAVQDRMAEPRIKAGADVLPWWPAKGVYLLIEQGAAGPVELGNIPGVAGQWSASAADTAFSKAEAGQQITYLFLDGDPVETGMQLKPALERRWETTGTRPLLAAPFYTLVPHEWDRYLPF